MAEAKILLYDLEITPILGWAYGMWDTRVIHIEREPYIMCFAYKWYGEKDIHVVAQPDFEDFYEAYPYDDILVVSALHALMDEADVVVAHNANKFDNRVAFERFLMHKMPPPSPFKTVDTLQASRRFFKNSSNSLDNMCKKLGIGGKSSVKHSDLWRNCVNMHTGSWDAMKKYNKRDITMLEGLYERLRPFITNHPNLNMFTKQDGCPKCGSRKVQRRGKAKSNVATYNRIQCQSCGAWSRERIADKDEPKPGVV
jgi:hypothetical protein